MNQSNSFRKAYVYVQDLFAGLLEETDSGYIFSYDDTYLSIKDATPISLTLPLKKEPYFSNVLFPFFDGLIPEGWLFDLVTKNWKIDKNDRFLVLLQSSSDPIGNVSIYQSYLGEKING